MSLFESGGYEHRATAAITRWPPRTRQTAELRTRCHRPVVDGVDRAAQLSCSSLTCSESELRPVTVRHFCAAWRLSYRYERSEGLWRMCGRHTAHQYRGDRLLQTDVTTSVRPVSFSNKNMWYSSLLVFRGWNRYSGSAEHTKICTNVIDRDEVFTRQRAQESVL